MKKALLSLLAVVLALGLAWIGCGTDEGPLASGSGSEERAPAAKKGGIPGPPDGGGNGKGDGKTAFWVDAVLHEGPYADPTLVSNCSGSTGETSLYARWPKTCGDGQLAVEITPTGSDYALTDDAQLNVIRKKGQIIAVELWIQDVDGPDGIQHSSERVPVDPSVVPTSAGFTLHVHADNVAVWRHKGHTGGPRVGQIGTISVGDIIFTPKSE